VTSDQLVQPDDILKAVRQLQRRSRKAVLQALEQTEPALAEHVMEELSRFHQRLLHSDVAPKDTRRIYHQCQSLVLVSVLALRQANVRLWREQMTGSRLVQLDPSLKPKDQDASDRDGTSGVS